MATIGILFVILQRLKTRCSIKVFFSDFKGLSNRLRDTIGKTSGKQYV